MEELEAIVDTKIEEALRKENQASVAALGSQISKIKLNNTRRH